MEYFSQIFGSLPDLKETFLYDWQDIIGSMIGASIPLFIAYFTYLYHEHRKFKFSLFFIEAQVVLCINNLLESKDTLKRFVEQKLPIIFEGIDEANSLDTYTISRAYLPDYFVMTIDEKILEFELKSSYLINRLYKAYTTSKDHKVQIEDIRSQYIDVVELQKELTLLKINGKVVQNENYRQNLNDFQKTITENVLGTNYGMYFNLLVEVLLVTRFINYKGLWKWKLKFDSRYKFFITRYDFEKYRAGDPDRISEYFKPFVDQEKEKIIDRWYSQ